MKGLLGFAVLMALQLICGGFLLWDVLSGLLGFSFPPIAWAIYELVEIGAITGLLLGMIVSASLLWRAIQRKQRVENSLRLASGAFMDVLEESFTDWRLTPAERDVALFLVKGCTTAEIATLRSTSEGTVKAQTNAVYRKANVSGRPQLLGLFIDDLINPRLP